MKAAWTGFRSPLASHIVDFLATKRALGCRFVAEDRNLRLLDRFLVDQGVATVDAIMADHIEQFLASRPRPAAKGYNHLLGVVRRLFDWLITQQVITQSPVRLRPRPETARRLPFLFDPPLARRLLAVAGDLPDNNRSRYRGATYRAIFALLYGLGLRVGEVSRLQLGDVDLDRDVLLIRNSKFGKTRWVPFGPRLGAVLRAYLAGRPRERGDAGDAPLFTWDGRQPVHTNSIRNTFREDIVPHLGLVIPAGTTRPRVHDLRHSFAVGTLLRWYRQGFDPAARLHHLSTFLGHVNPDTTAVYLTITSDLLAEANHRFEAFAAPITQEVRP
ncbi:MAG TPA: tyrosine-type recombinase/integrase [Vicinamibacterales bacterium]|nr:tyrosine-type recombinase/integrase [Vicinamibacterales bacterium]